MLAKRGAWVFRFRGKETVINGNAHGPAFVQFLLQNPGVEVHVEQFWREVMGTPPTRASGRFEHAFADENAETPNSLLGGADDLLDAQAKKGYETRLKELAVERTEAEKNKDVAALERIENEFEWIRRSLESAGDGFHKPKKLGDSMIRLRDRIRRRINAFMEHISINDPEGGQYLQNTIKKGLSMKYAPSQEIDWVFA